jgi:hypothetical protein
VFSFTCDTSGARATIAPLKGLSQARLQPCSKARVKSPFARMQLHMHAVGLNPADLLGRQQTHAMNEKTTTGRFS